MPSAPASRVGRSGDDAATATSTRAADPGQRPRARSARRRATARRRAGWTRPRRRRRRTARRRRRPTTKRWRRAMTPDDGRRRRRARADADQQRRLVVGAERVDGELLDQRRGGVDHAGRRRRAPASATTRSKPATSSATPSATPAATRPVSTANVRLGRRLGAGPDGGASVSGDDVLGCHGPGFGTTREPDGTATSRTDRLGGAHGARAVVASAAWPTGSSRSSGSGGPPLALVLRARRALPVGLVGGRGHPHEADLADLHPRVDRDRQAGHVGQLQRDVPVEPGVDEPGRAVDQQTEPAEARLALDAGRPGRRAPRRVRASTRARTRPGAA